MAFTNSEKWSNAVKKTGKIIRWMVALFVIFLAVFIFWKYFYTYSEGYRTGYLQKFSHKGTFFKTYEGEMVLSSVKSSADVALASEKFNFSVVNKNLVGKFDTLQGDYVIVHYRQMNGTVFWRGDSNYLVDSVKIKR